MELNGVCWVPKREHVLTFPLWYCFHTYITLKMRVLTRLFALVWLQRAPPPASFNHVFRSHPQMSESSYFHQRIQSLLISYVCQRITDYVLSKFPFPRDSEGTFAHLLSPHVPLRAAVSRGSVGVLCFLSELL